MSMPLVVTDVPGFGEILGVGFEVGVGEEVLAAAPARARCR